MALASIWIVLMDIASIQLVLPQYASFHVREIFTIILIAYILVSKTFPRLKYLYPLSLGIIIYGVFLMLRSTDLGVADSIYAFFRLNIFFILLLVLPPLIKTNSSIKKFIFFCLVFFSLMALSGPAQNIFGKMNWLYAASGYDPVSQGRAGFPRYSSILGDPNIGGFIGCFLLFGMLIFEVSTQSKQKTKNLLLKLTILSMSFILVVTSLSVLAFILYMLSFGVILLISKRNRKTLLILGVLILVISLVTPNLSKRIYGLYAFAATKGHPDLALIGSESDPRRSHFYNEIVFRLINYIGLLDSYDNILFGKGYGEIGLIARKGTQLIFPHNGYKELFLIGGVVGISLYFVLFYLTGKKAIVLLKSQGQDDTLPRGYILHIVCVYFFLLISMAGFPVHHYAGTGPLLWGYAAMIHILSRKNSIDSLRPIS